MGPTLPEGEEDDCLDGDELEDRLKRAQQVHGGKVEEEEGVKCQADREVVDDGDVEVATLDTAGRERAAALGCGKRSKCNRRQRRKKWRGRSAWLCHGGEHSTGGEGEAGRKGGAGGHSAFPLLVRPLLLWLTGVFCPFLIQGQ